MKERSSRFVQPLPFSDACERNKGPILGVLQDWLGGLAGVVVEIGAGTGQHAVHFAKHLPELSWQPTDQAQELAALGARIAVEGSCNLLPPVELDVDAVPLAVWSRQRRRGVHREHAAHRHLAGGACNVSRRGEILRDQGLFIVYGPFRYAGQYTSHSNKAFDELLRCATRPAESATSRSSKRWPPSTG